MGALCAPGARDLRSLGDQVVAVLCVRPAKDVCDLVSGAAFGTRVSRRLGCPVTAKIARPATLTCHEESLLSICGYRDIRLARFWQRSDLALVNEDCSSGALVVRGVFERRARCRLCAGLAGDWIRYCPWAGRRSTAGCGFPLGERTTGPMGRRGAIGLLRESVRKFPLCGDLIRKPIPLGGLWPPALPRFPVRLPHDWVDVTGGGDG